MKESSSSTSGPLDGLRVIEMAGLGPAPFCTMMLADMGAEVVRIDARQSRGLGAQMFSNAHHDIASRGRRSIALDLKHADGIATALQLIESADVLIEGFRPGVMERLGLGPEPCLTRNPKLVYGRMTGWGQNGPLAKSAGHDLNYIALSGALHAMGRADRPPPVPLNLVGDYGGGAMMLAFGIVCAVLETRQSGRGQVIDAAITDGTALLNGIVYSLRAAGIWNARRDDNLLDGGAPFYDNYVCADGRYISIGALEPQFFKLLCEKLGFDDIDLRRQNDRRLWPALRERFAATFATHNREHWCALLEGTDACFAPVLNCEEAPQHPQNLVRGTFIEIEGVTQPAPAPRFSRTPGMVSRPPPRVGEHSEGILGDWGFEAARIAELREREII